jgi:UDP-N-acetylmuramyl pentapeptide phosphotransferase/UDP-N-acetylglucosamine-1-phosphate transferase
MKIEHWLTIVAIIATSITTLAAPILTEFAKSRMSQPKPAPEPNQPKKTIHRIGGFVRISWMYLLAIVLNICVLLWELHHAVVPIKRDDVFSISITTGTIFSCLALIFLSLIDRTVGTLVNTSIEQAKISLKLSEITGDFQKQINDMLQASNLREKLDALKPIQPNADKTVKDKDTEVTNPVIRD